MIIEPLVYPESVGWVHSEVVVEYVASQGKRSRCTRSPTPPLQPKLCRPSVPPARLLFTPDYQLAKEQAVRWESAPEGGLGGQSLKVISLTAVGRTLCSVVRVWRL